MLQEGTPAELLEPTSLRGRYHRSLDEFVGDADGAIHRKGDSPIKEIRGLTLKGLGLGGKDHDVSVRDALEELRSPLHRPAAVLPTGAM